MTYFQFLAVLVFVTTCMMVTYQTQRKYLAVLKQRDDLARELATLIDQIGWYYPEGLSPAGNEVKPAKDLLVALGKRLNKRSRV